MKRMLQFAAMLVGLVVVGAAHAQAWPTRPVKFIISQPPGTAPDIITRLVTDQLTKNLGQSFIVENRPGAQNVIGAQAAARSAPDGYTFFVGTAAALVTNPLTFKTLPYDPAKDFTPVSMISKGPFLLVAHPSVPAKTLAELVALDKAQPGTLKLANEGPKSFGGMIAAHLNNVSGMKALLVPYNINSQGIQDTLAGTTNLTMQAVAVVVPIIKRGDLKAIAVSSAQRLPGLEDVPTIAETYPGFDANGWFILVAPTGTPPEIVSRLNREMDRILKDPAIVARMRDLGSFTDGAGSVESVAAFVRNERDMWTRVVREIGIEPE